MDKSRLSRQFEFILEADREKSILRRTLHSDGKTPENDAEHAWHMALMCVLLSEYSNEEIDVLRTISMVLIHDIVEIEAGDTYAYDAKGALTQRAREEKAADRLYGILPPDQGEKLRALWEEFEEGKTPEAKFARTLDCVQPLMLNSATNGKTWVQNGIKLSQVLNRNKSTADGSAVLWDYSYENFIRPNAEKGRLIDDLRC